MTRFAVLRVRVLAVGAFVACGVFAGVVSGEGPVGGGGGPEAPAAGAGREGETPGGPGATGESEGRARKIVLLAGPRDGRHPAGTHEYDTTVATIRAALEGSNVAGRVKVETHTNGWPEDPATLDDADAILLVSAGADHNAADHPFLVGDRMKVVGKQMERGCGLVMLHWSLFVPISHEKEMTRWLGGFFDYQRGDDARGWHSDITFASAKVSPDEKHEVAKGVPPFEHRDEYYYNIRFRKNDERLRPVVTVRLPEVEEPQVVAWTVERKDGGRGFAFTGGHFQNSWENEAYRTLMLNALCWTAKVPIPAGGVHKQLAFDDQWTPKRHLGKADLPVEKEEDWYDGRIRESDTGPFFTASIAVPPPGEAPGAPKDTRKSPPEPDRVTKAIAIKTGGEDGVPPGGVLFDKETMVLRCGWSGGFLNHSDRRFGLLEMPTIAGEVEWSVPAGARWEVAGQGDAPFQKAKCEWRGLRLDGHLVRLSYAVEGVGIIEAPSLREVDGSPCLTRTFHVEPSGRSLYLPVRAFPKLETTFHARLPDADGDAYFAHPAAERGYGFVAKQTGADGRRVEFVTRAVGAEDVVTLCVPPGDRAIDVELVYGAAYDANAAQETWKTLAAIPAPSGVELGANRPARRWGDPLVTRGVVGKPEAGSPFAVDTVTIPYENPFKALFFTSGFDFTPDGACYVSTAHGDVWKVTGIDEDLDEVKWQRFATGLYEPLGVKVRDGEVFVLGRDQITRLHDENGDGEADYYECFNDDLTDSGESHAYAMCLETDAEGNFYFLKSGAAQTPHGGTLLRLSADGKDLEVFATGFRHPNGLSVGPDGTVTAADNEGNWVPVTRVDFVEHGEFCGHVPTAHRDPEPASFGVPLCWLPLVVDNSAGGQVWVPEGAWGPFAGGLLHLSYGRCTANLILKERIEDVWQGGAVPLPLPQFLSGVCRGRFRTAGAGADGHLYVCGLDGWQTEARADGCLQRVRYAGGPSGTPTGLEVFEDGVAIAFPEPLDLGSAADAGRYSVEAWNYRWSKDYGSEDYSAADPTRVGRDVLKVTAAKVSEDGRRVFLSVDGLQPVMQLRVQAGVRTAGGAAAPVDYYGTVHRLRAGRERAVATGAAPGAK